MFIVYISVNGQRVASDTVYEYEEAEILKEEYQNVYGNNCLIEIEES